jgi:1-phosphofructokinase
VELVVVPIRGRTRSNLTLAEPDGTVTKINEPGPVLSAEELETLGAEILRLADAAEWVVLSGSTPPGLTDEAFGELCRRLVDAGARLAVDTSGPPLRAAVDAGAALVKPNREELAEVVGDRIDSLGDVVAAARRLRDWGAGAVLASLGQHGAVLVDAAGVVAGDCPVGRPRSSVGAGDALLAGFLAASVAARTGHAGTGHAGTGHAGTGHAGTGGALRGDDAGGGSPATDAGREKALAEGLAWGAAAVGLPGSRMPGPADLPRNEVRLHPRPDGVPPLPIRG